MLTFARVVIELRYCGRQMLTIEREIASQPTMWRSSERLARSEPELLPPHGSRLAVIGCGTSFYAAQAIAALREARGFGEADAFAASEFPRRRDYDAVLAISRSGTTTEVVRALESVRGATPSVAVSAVADSPVTRAADQSLILDFADEEVVVQTRFATSVLACVRAWLGEDIEPLAAEIESNAALALPLDPAAFGHFVFLAQGWVVGIANEAALKLRESAGAWTEAYPAMEYRHGPVSATTESTLVWALGEVDSGVLEAAAAAGATVRESRADPLAELVLVQRCAVALALARGRDPNAPLHLTRSVVLN